MTVFQKIKLVGILMSDRAGILKVVKERNCKDFSQNV